MPTPIAWSDDILVNTTFSSDQSDIRVAALADGRFIVVWEDGSTAGPDISGDAIRARILNADGTFAGAEFTVNTTTASGQYNPSVIALDTGGFVIAFNDLSATAPDTSSYQVRARVFGADGTAAGDDFTVNTTTTGDQTESDMTALADGGFVVTWQDYSQSGGDTSGYAIRAQIYNENGTARGGEFLVNTTTVSNQTNPATAALADGRFVVTWHDYSQSGGDTSSYAVRAQIFEADGTMVDGEFLVNTTTAVSQVNPAVAALADGGFVITWSDYSLTGADTSSGAIRAQLYDADGSARGDEFLVNTTTADSQSSSAVAALSDGRFVVTWQDYSRSGGDTSNYAIRAQVFNADGSFSGQEFLVNGLTSGAQQVADVAGLADGRIAFTYQDLGGNTADTFNGAVITRIFDPRVDAVDLQGTLADDQFVGTGWDDRMTGFLGNDTLNGGGGDDRLFGEDGNDTLNGGMGRDYLDGGLHDDTLNGGGQSDRIYGRSGNDRLDGGFGIDFLAGGTGNDTYVVDRFFDRVVENVGQGTDTVTSSAINLDFARYLNVERAVLTGSADLNIIGVAGRQVMIGNAGGNRMFGGGGNDVLRGNGDDDTLRGDAGADVLTGGANADTFVFRAASDSTVAAAGRDRITDFAHGIDTIDVSQIDARTGAGNQDFTFIGSQAFHGVKGELRVDHANGNTFVEADRNGDGHADFAILLNGNITLTAGDFDL